MNISIVDDKITLPPHDQRYTLVAEFLRVGFPIDDAAFSAGLGDFPEQYPDKAHVFYEALLNHPSIQSSLSSTSEALTREQIYDFIRDVLLTPIDEVDPTSRLCQKYKLTQKLDRDGVPTSQNIEVTMVDKLKAIDIFARMEALYAAPKAPVQSADASSTDQATLADAVAFVRSRAQKQHSLPPSSTTSPDHD